MKPKTNKKVIEETCCNNSKNSHIALASGINPLGEQINKMITILIIAAITIACVSLAIFQIRHEKQMAKNRSEFYARMAAKKYAKQSN